MFYFDNFNGKKVLKSDLLNDVKHMFTTRQGMCFDDFCTERIITPVQTHSDNIEIVDERTTYPNCDGLITAKKGDLIYLRFADCTPIIFYDKVNKIGAISHAGWRGTTSKIGVKTAELMQKHFETRMEDIIAVIGPAIGMCCYEVSEEVRDKLLSTVKNSDGLFNERRVDLKNINAQQLREIGIKNIDVCPYCTSCDNDLFYSYRKENGTTERHFALLIV